MFVVALVVNVVLAAESWLQIRLQRVGYVGRCCSVLLFDGSSDDCRSRPQERRFGW